MYPWLWFWAPQFHFPFSGAVAQRIEPDTNWFFNGIQPGAGNGDVEKQIFDVASYGRQLGWITEVLLAQTAKGAVAPGTADRALTHLEDVYRQSQTIKTRNADKLAQSAIDVLEKLRASNPAQFAQVMARVTAQAVAAENPRLLAHDKRKRP
ncbi:MAG: hypothetical protein ACXWJM_16745 [Ramlibacter sp.]